MKKFRLALGAAIILAAHLSAAYAIEFKDAVVGQPIADRTLTIGKLSMQLPAGEWILAAKTEENGRIQTNSDSPPRHRFAAVQIRDKTLTAIVVFRAPARSFYYVTRWRDDPCKAETSFIVKSTLQQTVNMPECFVVASQAAGTFDAASPTHKELVRWAQDNGYALPSSMLRVFYTKHHQGDYFRLNVYFAGDTSSASAAEAWGRQTVASLSAMVTRPSIQGKLPELPAFVAAPAGTQPVAARMQAPAVGANTTPSSAEARLRQLKNLLDSRLITPEEYEDKRKKIVEEM